MAGFDTVQTPLRKETGLPLYGLRTVCLLACLWFAASAFAKDGQVLIQAEDEKGQPVACRVRMIGPNGKPIRLPTNFLKQGEYFLFERDFNFKFREGDFAYTATRGHEYAVTRGGFTMTKDVEGQTTISVERSCNMREEGWRSGDLLTFMKAPELKRWMAGEDLDLAATTFPEPKLEDSPSKSKPNDPAQRYIDETARYIRGDLFVDQRPQGGLAFHGWRPADEQAETGLAIDWLKQAQQAKESSDIHIMIARPWMDEMPLWLAAGKIDSIAVLSDHLQPDKALPIPADCFNPDKVRFQGPRGLGRLVEFIYWQALEAGLRIPPAAGTGFGKGNTALGYNRVYTASQGSESDVSWWDALSKGRSVLTNGPVLRPNINGELPGAYFHGSVNQPAELQVGLTLTVRDPVEYLEVLHNMKSIYRARLDEHAERGGVIPPLQVKESGWVLLRVVTGHEASYRIAMTAPYYVQISGQTRISRSAVEFFQKWLAHTEARIGKLSEEKRKAYAPHLEQARKFWEARAEAANQP